MSLAATTNTEAETHRGGRSQLWFALIFFASIAVYGSLIPLNYQEISLNDAIVRFQNIPFLKLSIVHRADWVANILLFLPIGFFGLGAVCLDLRSIIAKLLLAGIVFAFCFVLSIGIEFSQIWFPPRTVSQNDIAAEAIGALFGIILWLLGGQTTVDWIRSSHWISDRRSFIDRLLFAYVVGFLIYAALPLDLTISPGEIYQKYKEGKIIPIPFQEFEWTFDWITQILGDMVIAIPVGAWFARAFRSSTLSVIYAILFIVLTEVVQLFVYSRYATTADLIVGSIGVCVGIRLTYEWGDRDDRRIDSKESEKNIWEALFWLSCTLGYSIGLALLFWWPLDFIRDKTVIKERLDGYLSVPFEAMYWGSEFNAITQFLKKTLLAAPIGALAMMTIHRLVRPGGMRGVMMAIGLLYCASVAVVIEIGQVALIQHTSDSTDSLIYLFGAILGMLITRRIFGLPKSELKAEPIREASRKPSKLAKAILVILSLSSIAGAAAWYFLNDSQPTNVLEKSGTPLNSSTASTRTHNTSMNLDIAGHYLEGKRKHPVLLQLQLDQ